MATVTAVDETSDDSTVPTPALDVDAVNAYGDTQRDVPYADALRELADQDWLRLHVPAHQGVARHAPEIAASIGEAALRLDFPVLLSQVDQSSWQLRSSRLSPLQRALRLAADAWGASRAWFVTNGASSANHVACLAARTLGSRLVVQRSMHSSVIDGMIFAGLDPVFAQPSVDVELGVAHGVTAHQIEELLQAHPDAASVYLVSPSYFGAVADIAAIAAVAHRHGVPLIVDEAWGSHLGFHPDLPASAIALGADLVISSTHKMAGSLFQSAMVLLGHGAQAQRLEPAVDKVYGSTQSTSASALLLLSLDEARRRIAVEGAAAIGRSLDQVTEIRAAVAAYGRFRDESARILAHPDVHGLDPFKIVINTAVGGIPGGEARHCLIRDHRIDVEMNTHAAVVALVGPQTEIDTQRLVDALHSLPQGTPSKTMSGPATPTLPPPCERVMDLRSAYFAQTRTVPAAEAIGRVSSDALSAYPPGIPNVLPGERLSASVITFLQSTAGTPSGYVRGAVCSDLSAFRVVDAEGISR